MATGFGIALHTAGLPVGPDRCERLARAVTVMGATTVAELRACALATMVSDPGQMPTFDRVFAAVFGGPSPFRHLNLPTASPSYQRPESDGSPQPQPRSEGSPGALPSGLRVSDAVPAADGQRRAAGRRARPCSGSPRPPSGSAAVTSPSSPRPNSASWSRSCAR